MVTLSRKAWPAAPPRVELRFALPRQALSHRSGLLTYTKREATIAALCTQCCGAQSLPGPILVLAVTADYKGADSRFECHNASTTAGRRGACGELPRRRSFHRAATARWTRQVPARAPAERRMSRRLRAPTRYHLPLTRQANKASEQSGHPDRAQCTAGRPLPAGAKAVSTRATCSPSCTRLC